MNLIILGKPGAGKGSLSKEFDSRCNLCHLSTGDILRKEIASGSRLGILANSYISKGHLIPDEIINGIIKNILSKDRESSYLFDGYPRTVAQAEAFKVTLKELNMSLDGVVYLDVSDELVVRRLSSRRICPKCSRSYNIESKGFKPLKNGICDDCGTELVIRDDDNEASIKERLVVYSNQTQPLIDFYKKENLLIEVNGQGNIEEIYLNAASLIEARKKN